MYPNNSFQLNNKVWKIEKYQRLADIRNCPMAVERKSNDLIIQVNMNLKMLSVSNNETKLEEFCFSPLVYSHDVICKDTRVLFTTKSQKDGNINAKFRVRFRTIEICQNFCGFLSNFITVTMYEDMQKRDVHNVQNYHSSSLSEAPSMVMTDIPHCTMPRPASQPSLLNRSFGNEPINRSLTNEYLNRSFGDFNRLMDYNRLNSGMDGTQSYYENDYPYFESEQPSNFNRSFSENLNLSIPESTKSWVQDRKENIIHVNKVGIDQCTQTKDVKSNNGVYVDSSYNNPGEFNLTNIPPIQPVVNISIGNLISDEAMKGFSSVLQSFLESFLTLMTTGNIKFSKKNKKPLLPKKNKNPNYKPLKPKKTYVKKKNNDLTNKKKKESFTKQLKKKKEITYFHKPEPTMPTNRKGGGHYTLRGQAMSDVVSDDDNESAEKEITFDNNEQNVDTEISNTFNLETNNTEINDYLDIVMSASSSYLRKLERERVGNVIPSTSRQSWRLVTKAILNGFVSKYQNRRSQILKSVNPFRSPVNISKIQTRQTIFVNNQRLRIHDIVSIIDSKDESKKYFGQIIALVTDSYAKHFVYLIWLVPKHPDESKFSPENFIHGITDERAIPADCCVFESSCPLLPRYMRTWTPEKMIEEQTRIEVAQRIQNIRVNENPTLPNIRDDFKNAI